MLKPKDHNPDRSWFDASAWDHAWWQKAKKRAMVYIHAAERPTAAQNIPPKPTLSPRKK